MHVHAPRRGSGWEEVIEHPGLSYCDMPLSNLLNGFWVNSCRSLKGMRSWPGRNCVLRLIWAGPGTQALRHEWG